MTVPNGTSPSFESPVRPEEADGIFAIIMGVEGEGINTEDLHYQKWRIQAVEKMKVIGSDEEFKTFWRSECIGPGDLAIYEKLKDRASDKENFPDWKKTVEPEVNAYYESHLDTAEIPEGFAQAYRGLMRLKETKNKDVSFMVVTHAEKPLVTIQFGLIRAATATEGKDGIALDPEKDVIYHEKKNENAYVVALERINKSRAEQGLSELKPKNVLILDSKKYRKRAEDLGFKAMTIALDLPEHLLPMPPDAKDPAAQEQWAKERAAEKDHQITWCGVYGLITGKGKDYSPKSVRTPSLP